MAKVPGLAYNVGMSHTLAPPSPPPTLATLSPQERQEWADVLRGVWSDATRRAYASDWQAWCQWCEGEGLSPLPATPGAVVRYVLHRSKGHRLSTLLRDVGAIHRAHVTRGLPSPCAVDEVRLTVKGLRRKLGSAPSQKDPLLLEDVERLLETIPLDTARGTRDRALLLLGIASSMRRSELVSLDQGDITINGEGAIVHLQRGKTDQEGLGRDLGIVRVAGSDLCPVAALEAWLRLNPHSMVFPSFPPKGDVPQAQRLEPREVARIIKKYAARAGMTNVARLAGHSLRSGHVTQAMMNGATDAEIMTMTGHRSVDMLHRYRRKVNVIEQGSSAAIFAPRKNRNG